MLQDVERVILEYFFRHRMLVGGVIDELRTKFDIKAKLSDSDIKRFPEHVRRLRQKGVIDLIENYKLFSIILTSKGYETIYPIRDETDEIVIKNIVDHFMPRSGIRVSQKHSLYLSELEFMLTSVLNPRECEVKIYWRAITELMREDLVWVERKDGQEILYPTDRCWEYIDVKQRGWE